MVLHKLHTEVPHLSMPLQTHTLTLTRVSLTQLDGLSEGRGLDPKGCGDYDTENADEPIDGWEVDLPFVRCRGVGDDHPGAQPKVDGLRSVRGK